MAYTGSIENAMRFVVCILHSLHGGNWVFPMRRSDIAKQSTGLGSDHAGPRDSAVAEYRLFEADGCRICARLTGKPASMLDRIVVQGDEGTKCGSTRRRVILPRV
jgi:hypothetical protein